MSRDSDIAELGRLMKERRKEVGATRLAKADPTGWTKHTEHHWSRDFMGARLDYWPSRSKWQYQGRVISGSITQWMLKRDPSMAAALAGDPQ